MQRILALGVLVAALAFVASPLVVTGFNGFTPGQFPIPQEDPPVQPAGTAFSIWGLIYAWLLAGAAYGWWKAQDDPDWQPMRPWLLASLGMGAFWLPVAQRAPGPATVLILAMLVTALAAVIRSGRRDAVWQSLPIGLYAGWLTAATGVSVGLMLAGHGWTGQTMAAVLALGLVLATGLSVQPARPRVWTYPAALIWALAWIAVVNVATPNLPVLAAAVIGAAAFAARLWTARGKRATSRP